MLWRLQDIPHAWSLPPPEDGHEIPHRTIAPPVLGLFPLTAIK